ncbi:hypothetical protein V8G54_032516 [Vigna mungo]|uniref:Uncharacterized protein n=1 Tax=Vigna mungo TaxID=3915 RepID=A0AAQ3MMA5_VIGMU
MTDNPGVQNSVEMAFNYCHVTKSKGSAFGGNLLTPRREKKENVARFASMEDDFANCTTHGSMKKTNLVVGEDDDPGALHNGGKDCRADDEALDLDDSWSRLRFRDLGEIATLMMVAMEVACDGCHGYLQVRLHGGMVTLDDLYGDRFGGLKVEEDGGMAVVKCYLNTIVHT